MESKYKKSTDLELLAIYRLEFYKKQRNWKFCQDFCNKKATEPAPQPENDKGSVKSANSSKSILNKTYNLETDEVPSELNNGFLEPDPADLPPVTSLDPIYISAFSPPISDPNALDEKWPEPQQRLPETQQHWPETQPQWPEKQQQLSETQQSLPEIQRLWPVSEKQWLEMGKNLTEAGRVWSVPEMPEQFFQKVGQKWGGEEAYCAQDVDTLRAYEMDRGWTEPCPDVPDTLCGEQVQSEALLSAVNDWLKGAPRWPADEPDTRSASTDSVLSFIRGAAAAPHSSEVDLNVSHSSEPPLSACGLACLSRAQLAGALRRRAGALALVLREARARDTQPRPLSTDYRTVSLSCDEPPTRDIDLFPPADSFVAGSFTHEPGRGRGRLRKDRLIGIGMGRPYRL